MTDQPLPAVIAPTLQSAPPVPVISANTHLFAADEQVSLTKRRYRRIQSNRNELVRINLPKLYDEFGFVPWTKGSINYFIAESGNAKSSLFDWCALDWANYLKDKELQNKMAVVLVKTESTIETAYGKMVAPQLGLSMREMLLQMSEDRLDEGLWQRMEDYGVKHSSLPLWMVGHSSERPDPGLEINIPLIGSVLKRMQADGIDTYILLIDHLHDIADTTHRDTQDRVEWLAAAVRDNLSSAYGVTTWVAAQANGDVHKDGMRVNTAGEPIGNPIPNENSAMWAPQKVKQVGDNILTGCYVAKYRKPGDTLKLGGIDWKVQLRTEYILTAAKQRDGDPNVHRLIWWKPGLNIFSNTELPDDGMKIVTLNPEQKEKSS